MENIKNNIIKIGLLGFMAVHLTMHILYLIPNNPATPLYSKITDEYMETFFTQNWHLFAPEPAISSLDFSYRCSPNEQWQFPLKQLFSEHKAFPLTAKGKQTYVLQNLVRETFNSKLKQRPDNEIPEITTLQRYLKDKCGKYSKAELEIQRIFTQDYSKRLQQKSGIQQTFKFSLQQKGLAWN